MSTSKFFELFQSFTGLSPVRARMDKAMFPLSLPSAIEGSDYDATVTARWATNPQGPPPDHHELRRQIFACASAVTARRSVHEIELAGIELNAQLQQVEWTAMTNIDHPVVTVKLGASPEVRQTAAEWAALRSQLSVERMRNQLENEQLRHLREDIFKKPDVARTYWLKHHPEATAEILGDRFERIAEKLGTMPETSTLLIANLLHEFLSKLSLEQQQYLVEQLHRVFGSHDREDLADQLPSVSTGVTR